MPITEQQIQKVMGSRAYAYEQNGNLTFMIVDADQRSLLRVCDRVSGKIENVRLNENIIPAITFMQHSFMSSPRQAYIPLSECVDIVEGYDSVAVVVQKGSYSVHGM